MPAITIDPETGWEIWPTGWIFRDKELNAKPPGAPIAVVHAHTEDELREEIRAWNSRTPEEVEAHLAELRKRRDEAPGSFEREYFEQRIMFEGAPVSAAASTANFLPGLPAPV